MFDLNALIGLVPAHAEPGAPGRKLAQAFMYGSKVVAIEGNFDDALRLVREIGETEPIA